MMSIITYEIKHMKAIYLFQLSSPPSDCLMYAYGYVLYDMCDLFFFLFTSVVSFGLSVFHFVLCCFCPL